MNVPLPALPLPSLLQCQEMHELNLVWNSRNYWIAKGDVISWCNKLNGFQTGDLKNIPSLEHRLSDKLDNRIPDIDFKSRSPIEVGFMCISLDNKIPRSASEWQDWIIDLNTRVVDGNSGFRTDQIYTERDRFGGYAIYPSFDLVPGAMNYLSLYQEKFCIDYPIETAVVSLAFIGAIHPFRDGNGRTSRIVFNAIAGSMDRDRYLPLHELAAHSRDGYILALREAQYLNNWKPLIIFLTESCKILGELVRNRHKPEI